MKTEQFHAFSSSSDHNYLLSVYRKFADSPRYNSEWEETFGPRSYHNDDTSTSNTEESPLVKKSVEAFTAVPQANANVGIVTPAKGLPPPRSVSSNAQQFTSGKADLIALLPVPIKKKVKSMDVFWAMINDVTGKDKLAKFGQYSFRLLLHHAKKTQTYLSNDEVNIGSISRTCTGNKRILSLLMNFLHDPRSFFRFVGVLMCSVFISRCSALVPALGTFRQILRFGKSPFLVRSLWLKMKENVYYDAMNKQWRLRESLFSKSTLEKIIPLYYSLNDETVLLFKLKFYKNETLKAIAGRHEAYAWYCDSWLALFNSFNQLQKLTQQEIETSILIQVKKRSWVISKQILGPSSFQMSSMVCEDDDKDTHALNDIKSSITNTKLDILKAISDIICNSYTVFNTPLHFDTVQIWTGLSAALLSSIKIFREKRLSLERR